MALLVRLISTFAILICLTACSNAQVGKSSRSKDSNEGNVAKVVARILEQSHYSRKRFDDTIASRFLDRYLESLDSLHLTLFQSDLEEFGAFRNNLDELTKAGNITPARRIFDRHLHRLRQQASYAQELLANEEFRFDGNDTYTIERGKAPWPKNLEEARDLWRQRLRYEYLQEKLRNKSDEQIKRLLTRRYESGVQMRSQLDTEDLLELYLSALTEAYDPHSDYLGRSQFENFGISMKLSLVGIGAELGYEDGYCVIKRLLPGPASATRQLRPGDRILAVAQEGEAAVEVVNVPLPKVAAMVRGPKGSRVNLVVSPSNPGAGSSQHTVTVTRTEIKLADQEAKAKVVDFDHPDLGIIRLGIIDLPSFYEELEPAIGRAHKSTATDVAKLLRKLKQERIQGLILDLRANTGGSLDEAINLTGLFIPRGPVVQIKDSKGKIGVESDKNANVAYNGPMVVLTSRLSASASEIVAGALQDYGRAIIAGDSSTYGKGTVQALLKLSPLIKRLGFGPGPEAGGITVTVQKFYRPSGSSTQLRGVTPDVVIPSFTEQLDEGEKTLPHALTWDNIPAANYRPAQSTSTWRAELGERSQRRMQHHPFTGLVRNSSRLSTNMTGNIVLNEARLRGIQDEGREQLKKHLARLTPQVYREQRIYDITLAHVNVGGLPLASDLRQALTQRTLPQPEMLREATLIDGVLEEGKYILADLISLSPQSAR